MDMKVLEPGKLDFRKICYGDVVWIHLIQDKHQWWSFCKHINESSVSTKGRSLD
jgi:hypothetical protein